MWTLEQHDLSCLKLRSLFPAALPFCPSVCLCATLLTGVCERGFYKKASSVCVVACNVVVRTAKYECVQRINIWRLCVGVCEMSHLEFACCHCASEAPAKRDHRFRVFPYHHAIRMYVIHTSLVDLSLAKVCICWLWSVMVSSRYAFFLPVSLFTKQSLVLFVCPVLLSGVKFYTIAALLCFWSLGFPKYFATSLVILLRISVALL